MRSDRGQRFATRHDYAIAVTRGRLRGRALFAPPVAVGISMTESVLMPPSAIAAELARVNLAMRSFGVDMAAALDAKGVGSLDVSPKPAAMSDDGPGLASRILAYLTGATVANAMVIAAEAAAHHEASGNPSDPIAYILSVAKASASTDPAIKFIHDQWLPFYAAWNVFYGQEKDGAWFHNAAYDAEKYLAQLVALRKTAKSLGIKILSPEPEGEHLDGLPSWLLPVGVGVGALVALSMLTRGNG